MPLAGRVVLAEPHAGDLNLDFLKKFIADERGATAIEYGLIAALISIMLVTAMGTLKTKIIGTYTKVSTAMPQ